jgi:hypothetical protein
LIGLTIRARTAKKRSIAVTKPIVEHRIPHRFGGHGDLDQNTGILNRLADHPHDLGGAVEKTGQRVPDQRPGRRIAQIEGRLYRRRHLRVQNKLAHLVAAQHDIVDARVLQQFGLQVGVDHVVSQKRKRRDLRPLEARQHVVLAKTRDRGHENENFGQHHEKDREDKETTGERIQEHMRLLETLGQVSLYEPDDPFDRRIIKESG